MTKHDLISVVIPLYNEETNIRPLFRRIAAVFDGLWCDFEVVFVDDGSDDHSADVVKDIRRHDGRARLLRLSRNFGCQSAILAGLEHSRGAAVVVMDADLQHPPELISQLVSNWKEGFDVVYAVRTATEDTTVFKRFASFVFARLLRFLADTDIDPGRSDFQLMDRKVVEHLVRLKERNRFFRSLVAWVGFRQKGIPYVAARRHSGKTKFPVRKLLSLALDAITSFSTVPLRLCTYLGFAAALSGVPYLLWAVYVRLFTDSFVPGWSALIVALLFLGGVQLISLGILGEYVGRIYDEVRGRPLYITRERLGFGEEVEYAEEGRDRAHCEVGQQVES